LYLRKLLSPIPKAQLSALQQLGVALAEEIWLKLGVFPMTFHRLFYHIVESIKRLGHVLAHSTNLYEKKYSDLKLFLNGKYLQLEPLVKDVILALGNHLTVCSLGENDLNEYVWKYLVFLDRDSMVPSIPMRIIDKFQTKRKVTERKETRIGAATLIGNPRPVPSTEIPNTKLPRVLFVEEFFEVMLDGLQKIKSEKHPKRVKGADHYVIFRDARDSEDKDQVGVVIRILLYHLEGRERVFAWMGRFRTIGYLVDSKQKVVDFAPVENLLVQITKIEKNVGLFGGKVMLRRMKSG